MAEDISETYTTRPISGFGISLSGGQDMDGQGYADILVGAHSSSHVVLLRYSLYMTVYVSNCRPGGPRATCGPLPIFQISQNC